MARGCMRPGVRLGGPGAGERGGRQAGVVTGAPGGSGGARPLSRLAPKWLRLELTERRSREAGGKEGAVLPGPEAPSPLVAATREAGAGREVRGAGRAERARACRLPLAGGLDPRPARERPVVPRGAAGPRLPSARRPARGPINHWEAAAARAALRAGRPPRGPFVPGSAPRLAAKAVP